MQAMLRFSVAVVLVAAVAACSQAPAPATPSAPVTRAPTGPVIPLHAPASAAATAAAAADTGPSLAQLLQRPGFARALHALDGATALPAWVEHGATAMPSEHVEVAGRPLWIAEACADRACESGRLLLLVDPVDHSLRGLLVDVSGAAGAQVQQLTWLGHPDPAAQAFLKARMGSD